MHRVVRLESVRPLVRYVDHDHAVIDAHFTTLPAVAGSARQSPGRAVDVFVEIDGSDGFHDEGHTRVQLTDHRGSVRFEIVRPQRWWPAGMGEQAMYTLSVTVAEGELGDAQDQVTFGLTSVRRDRVLGEAFDESLLVNGQICDIDSVVVVDRADANHIGHTGNARADVRAAEARDQPGLAPDRGQRRRIDLANAPRRHQPNAQR